MCGTVTDDDLEKRVESATGDEIGTITDIDEQTAQVDPRPGMIDSIKATLGWPSSGETITIHEHDIGEITTDAVRLEDGALEESNDTERRDLEDDSSTVLDTDAASEPATEESPAGSRVPQEDAELDNAAERDPAQDSTPGIGGEASREEPDTPDGDEMPNAAARDEAYEDLAAVLSDDDTDGMGSTEPVDDVDAGDADDLLPGGEPDAADDSTTHQTDAAETDPADEISTGIDADSLKDASESATDARVDDAESEGVDEPTEIQDLLADTGSGLSPESADVSSDVSEIETDAEGPDAAALDESVNTGVDLESAVEADDTGSSNRTSRPDEESERDDSADAIDPGVDVVSTMHAEQESPAIDPETIVGQEPDGESGPETAARRVVSADSATTDADESQLESKRDRPALPSSTGREHASAGQERSSAGQEHPSEGPRSSPLSAAFATQRAALTSGRAAVELGLESQQQAARVALEGPMMAQQRALEAMESTMTGSPDAGTATSGTSPRDRQRSTTSTELGAEELSDALEDHREHVQKLRSAIGDRDDYPDDRAANRTDQADDQYGHPDERLLDALERQAALLERCHRHLESRPE